MVQLTPIGIAWRKGFVRMCSDCFDKPYLISEMKRSHNNIMPVIVIDIITKKAKCYLINDTMTDFDDITSENRILCKRVGAIANYMINKKNIQKSNLSIDEKEVACKSNDLKHYHNQKLKASIQSKFIQYLTKVGLVESV